jgi:hypothetical protein
MPKKYETSPDDVAELADSLIEKHYPDLKQAGVTIEFQNVWDDNGTPLSLRGHPCQAIVKIISLADRAAGAKDAKITIDADNWENLDEPQRAALMDHELYHLCVRRNPKDNDNVKLDTAGRPMLRMRQHDVEVGWFIEIAERHKENSIEVMQARSIWEQDGQILFPFLDDPAPGEQLRTVPRRGKRQKPADETPELNMTDEDEDGSGVKAGDGELYKEPQTDVETPPAETPAPKARGRKKKETAPQAADEANTAAA